MELWEKIIVEWINCLEILKKPIKNTTELQDGIFYVNFLTLIKWSNYKNQEDIIIKFVEDEYPSFKVNKEDDKEHIYIASLLLVHFCQKLSTVHHSLQDNICENLKHETQIRVKIFLESILPLGRDITRETMREVVEYIEDTPIATNNHKTPPIKDFLNSPLVHSVRSKQIMTERIRELRDLRCNLAVERYANSDLRDDIQRQQNKIWNLQKMLDEKSAEIKELREEWMKPCTPRPSHTREEDSQEDYYKKYISDMESQLSKQQDEINNLEVERDIQSKRLSSMHRELLDYKEKFATSEQCLQSLSSKTELKDRELVQLRIHNEELRAHIKELNKNSNTEQSFEVEDLLPPNIRMSLNTSEALSTVIEIQLQESKEECAILSAQVDSLKGKLDVLTSDYKTTIEANKDLKKKVKTLNSVQAELNDVQKKLDTSNINITNLEMQKMLLETQSEHLMNLLSHMEKKLSEVELVNTTLNTELSNLKDDAKNLNELLENEKANSSKLNTALEQTKILVIEHLAYIQELTDERDSYKSSIQDCSKNLRNILHCGNQFIEVKADDLDNSTLSDLTKYVEIMLHNNNIVCVSYKCDIEKLKATIDETSKNLSEQQLTVTHLEKQNKQNLIELANIEEDKKQKDLLLNDQKETIHNYSQEIKVLKEIRNEKLVLEQNVHDLTNDLKNRELLLKSLMMQLKDLQKLKKDFELVKEETQRDFTEYQEHIKVIFEKLQQRCQTLCYEFYKMQCEKEKLDHNFNRNREELSNIQAINAKLQEDLLDNKEIINVLEERERVLSNELNESKQNIQELKKSNRILEEQYATMEIEVNDNLESLKVENAKVSFKLKDITDKYNLLQQEMSETTTQMESKVLQFNELLLEVSSLKAEKELLAHSHQEILRGKDEEINTREKALLTSQTKMEKLMNEASATEKKMKEIIINLQEVRSTQDAVLVTQEVALQEKCLHIEELQERFDNSKKILSKELEDANTFLHEYQIKFFELENQLDNENRNVKRLEGMMEVITVELETVRKRCKDMDTNEAEIAKICEELEHTTKNLNSTIIKSCSDFDFQDSHDVPRYEFTCTDNQTANILNVIKMAVNELHKSQKVTSHLSDVNVELNKTLAEQKILIETSRRDKEESCSLKTKIQELEIIAEKRNDYLKNLIKNKESLKDSLQKMYASQSEVDIVLASSKQKWNEALTKFHNILYIDSSNVCDEYQQLQAKKASIENTLSKYQMGYLENIKVMSDILWEKFLWTEQKLHDTYLCSVHEKECLDVLTNMEENQFSNERTMIDVVLETYEALRADVIKSFGKEIESFTSVAMTYDNNLKSGEIKSKAEIEKKLQNQINQLTKEKKELNNKMDTMRLRNVKLERSIDDLRTEIKKSKSMEAAPMDADLKEVQSLKDELERLKEQNQQLHEEKSESSKIAKQEVENRLKEFHVMYERKLEDIKQKMKMAYSEQITKLNKDQEKIIQDKLQTQMEAMCQKQREELNRYKAHVGELSSQLWSVGEKLLIEQQQKQDTVKRLKELETKIKEIEGDQSVATISRKTCKMEKQELLPDNVQQGAQQRMTTLITEETFERRQSVRSMQAMGNVFKTEDEEEVFDNVYLADMKKGNCLPTTDVDRLSVLQMRNNLCKPHLKSSYPAEMQFLSSTLTEEEIKAGSPIEENFNDSLSQSLLPEQKARKKDRSQTSYKKPGPPTPSKNGGRLSLQSNEMRSPRVLKERNAERKTTTTPHSLKNIFSLRRQDENASSTPRTRRLSNLFRKPRLQSERSDR